MANTNNTPKVPSRSAADPAADHFHATLEELDKIQILAIPFCTRGSDDVILDRAYELSAILDAVELNMDELPDSSPWVIRRLRAMATQAIKYSHELVECSENKMRHPAPREVAHV